MLIQWNVLDGGSVDVTRHVKHLWAAWIVRLKEVAEQYRHIHNCGDVACRTSFQALVKLGVSLCC